MPRTDPGAAPSRARSHLLSRARPIAVALAACLAVSCAAAEPEEATASVESAADAVRLFAGIPQHGDVLGDPGAPVTLLELTDLRCSHCRDFAEITLPVVVDRYVRTGQLRVVLGDLPILGPASVQAARMAAAAGLQDHLFEFTEVFFSRASGPVSDELLRWVAGAVPGLDVQAAMAASSSDAVTEALARVRALADRYSIRGTPSFLLGRTHGELVQVQGVWPGRPETLTEAIDAQLAAP
jgi:protein-disulfide isomerase